MEQRFHIKPQRLVGDTTYGTVSLLGWMVHDKGIAPHVPVWDESDRTDGTLSRGDFTFDRVHDRYLCPTGGFLHTTGSITTEGTILYRASKLDCTTLCAKAGMLPQYAGQEDPAQHS